VGLISTEYTENKKVNTTLLDEKGGAFDIQVDFFDEKKASG
jgi:hypothetical protein